MATLKKRHSKYNLHRADFPDDKSYNVAMQRIFRRSPNGKAHVRRMNTRAKGITPERYNELLASQGGKCAVCGKSDPGSNQHGPQSFCVDHDKQCCPGDRSCGKCVRGLLCHNCNRAEGLLNGNAQALATYLSRYRRGKPKVYCAGPMTGYPEFNYPLFHQTATKLRKMGFEVVSPAELNPIEPDLQVDEDYHRKLYPSFMRRDIAALIECDHIVMLDGWEKSKGAALEHHIAQVLGIVRIELQSNGDE